MPNIPNDELIRSIIQRIAVGPDRGKDISEQEAYQATIELLNHSLDPVHAALFLIGLRMKRETIEEFLGMFRGLNHTLNTATCDVNTLLYLADPFDGYIRNIPSSPFLPPVLAACGQPCVIQGVHSVGPKFGATAHQVYALLGINCFDSIDTAANKLENQAIGWAYIDQSVSNPQLAELTEFRHKIVKRSAITTLERVLMPIKAKQNYLALGFVHKAYPEIYAAIAQAAKFDQTLLIKGMEGGVTPALDKPVRSFTVNMQISDKSVDELNGFLPTDITLSLPCSDSVKAIIEQTAELGFEALTKHRGAYYDVLIHNAAYLLWKFNPKQSDTETYLSCLDKVKTKISSGEALSRLEQQKTS